MRNSFAYLDPGSGSMIVQVLVGAAVTVLVFFRAIREKIKSIFKSNKKED